MQKQVSLIGLLAIAVVGFIWWRDPGGLATTMNHLWHSVLHLLGQAVHRLSTTLGQASKP